MRSFIEEAAERFRRKSRYPLGLDSGGPSRINMNTGTTTTTSSSSSATSNHHHHNQQHQQQSSRDSSMLFVDQDEPASSFRSAEEGAPEVYFHPYEQPESTASIGSLSVSPNRYLNPSYASATSSSIDSESSSSSIIIDPTIVDAAKMIQPNVMTIQRASTENIHRPSDEVYRMTNNPRGPCLIINNVDFEADIFPQRKGSDEDARRFDDIFQQLGFKVFMFRNQTADQMKKLFKDLARECRKEHDALFVFILSHGSEHGIFGTDGIEVCLESEIISNFDNRSCEAMVGKPKVFVLQACRGRAKDCGGDGDTTDSIAWSPSAGAAAAAANTTAAVQTDLLSNRVPASWLPSNQPQDSKKREYLTDSHPDATQQLPLIGDRHSDDQLLIGVGGGVHPFNCTEEFHLTDVTLTPPDNDDEGFVSVRNETAGSWLGVALAYFLMRHAHERDFLRILNSVSSDVIQRESSNGHIQSIELKLLGWTKDLYFNPGFYA